MFKSANVQKCKCTNMQMCKSASCALLMDSRRGRLGERRRGALLHYCAISVQLQSVANCLQNRFDNLLAHLYLYSFYFLKHLIYWTAPWKKFKGEKIEDKQKSLSKNIHNPRVPSGPKPLRREFQSGPFWSETLRQGGTIQASRCLHYLSFFHRLVVCRIFSWRGGRSAPKILFSRTRTFSRIIVRWWWDDDDHDY